MSRSGFTFSWLTSLYLSPYGLLPGEHCSCFSSRLSICHHCQIFNPIIRFSPHEWANPHPCVLIMIVISIFKSSLFKSSLFKSSLFNPLLSYRHHPRFSPHEWANPHPCVDTGFVVQNDFTLANRFVRKCLNDSVYDYIPIYHC